MKENEQTSSEIGVIYVAYGAEYLDLAEQSVRTLRKFNGTIPVEVFTDQQVSSGLFDRVRPISAGATPKLACLKHSSFERTLYLDCDTLVVAPLGDLFEILGRFDLAVAHDVRRKSQMIRRGKAVQTPYAFPQMNAGVILYRMCDKVKLFLSEWERHYKATGLSRDQVSFRDLLWESDLRFYVLPPEFNLRRVTHLETWEPLDARPTIVHSHRLLQHLRSGMDRLRTVDDIVEAERLALAEEWSRFSGFFTPNDGFSATARHHVAEREHPESYHDPLMEFGLDRES